MKKKNTVYTATVKLRLIFDQATLDTVCFLEHAQDVEKSGERELIQQQHRCYKVMIAEKSGKPLTHRVFLSVSTYCAREVNIFWPQCRDSNIYL